MKVVVTGAGGFLGWHTRVRLKALTDHDVIAVDRSNWHDLARLAKGADAIVHIAGVNRAPAEQVEQGNIDLASAVANAAVQGGSRPRIVYANSVHAGTDTAYGRGKDAAGAILADAAQESGGSYTDVRLPNLFGEHGRPQYNSFVATFVDAVARGCRPDVQDRRVTLLHAQAAAESLLEGLTAEAGLVEPSGHLVTVEGVLDRLQNFASIYAAGEMPALQSDFDVDLFNSLRASLFPGNMPITLPSHSDARGRLVETVRSHGGQGQTFVSSTRAGITRGEHFHLRKIERFVVVSGRARITLRKLLTEEVISFEASGDEPVAVDMPTMWAHSITNVGDDELMTQFWTSTLFDPLLPDTFAELVDTDLRDAPTSA